MSRRPSRGSVAEVARPFSLTFFHPDLGVLDVEASAPAATFGIGDVAATPGAERRWFVGGYASGDLALSEVSPDVVMEELLAPRHGTLPAGFVRGYLTVQAFEDHAEAEAFARFATHPSGRTRGSGGPSSPR